MQLKLIASIFAGMLLAAGCQRVFACDDVNHRNWTRAPADPCAKCLSRSQP